MRRLLVVLLLAAGLTVAAPAYACACGGLVDQPGGDTTVAGETALVVWDGTRETISLRLSTRTDAVTAGLLVPTPAPASVALGDEGVFQDLSAVVAPRTEQRRHLFGPPLLWGGGGGDDASAGGPAGVSVLSTVDLGPLRATTIATASTAGLAAWLKANHFAFSFDLKAAVQPYIDERWSFVAVQLNAVGQTLEGELPPIAMTFSSDTAVYPMRMSSVADEPQQPLVYVLAPHRMLRTDPVASAASRPDVLFAGRVPPGDVASPALQRLLTTTPYLSVTSQWLPEPTEIVSDFTYERAADDTPFHRVAYDESYLLPGDVGALLVLLLLGAAAWLVVRLVRRPQ